MKAGCCRAFRAAATLIVAGVLAACGLPGVQEGSEGLRPLSPQPPTPAGAPRSRVPPVDYGLTSPGGDEGPQDGVPGEVFQRGGASWYGIDFHQRKTANGERFNMYGMTAAHRTLPFNTRVCVRSLVNGREVLVRVNDRGPFAPGRIIDLSRAAAEELNMIGLGIKHVALMVIDQDGMRCDGKTVGPKTATDSDLSSDDDAGATPNAKAAPKRNSSSGKATVKRRPKR
ncbi:septal ring lytic transglycosylase RlpA family protein [Variovorax dokdonensis]|uniref:Endolytic peptidoglycan transglycosylase RlpA n=1 Tax=Variovorax dokdonensis TaxID=344883 RepID=A0ABT7N510_9BURK|nr:septal ring lytic transglycosylase RlpA family protein [Variovorax dokdonensis]MDM0043008.1 septal ring lytic transglycosylase RlpA family protein [Variovorax dokdonensis]